MDLPESFETHPSRYKHWRLELGGKVAFLHMQVQENEPLQPGYVLKLNSYDLGVDIELADAVQRLRFEHPAVGCVVITSATPSVFSSGANIFMLGASTHHFKVNFCKYTNETRLAIEDASLGGQKYLAAVNGIASGGGYELALACDEIHLVDDRKSAVALPEVPYLGVLPGTGGLTRVVDKRKVRRDLADVFCTLAEGVKGKRALEWRLVDAVWPSSRFKQEVQARAEALAALRPAQEGIVLEPLGEYRFVKLQIDAPHIRVATLSVQAPTDLASTLRVWREIDDVSLRLRFHHPNIGLVVLRTHGDPRALLALEASLYERREQCLVKETLAYARRVLKRVEMNAKSMFTLVEKDSCVAGSFYELALAGDRIYLRQGGSIGVSALNLGHLQMANGLSRLQTRFLAKPAEVGTLQPRMYTEEEADAAGLATMRVDNLDWDDDVRLAIEERASLSPDALTGCEANLRFCGPETMETKIFGRLSAWQNWIFQRDNAVGEKGALTLYGRPERAEFDWSRT